MRPSPRRFALLLVGSSTLFAGAQVPVPAGGQRSRPDLVAAIFGKPWDAAAQGPLVMVIPMAPATGTGLDGLGLKTAVVGGLTALVPKAMVTVDSRPPDSPNLYEGLPQEAKVMYLMRSFDSGQWAKATAGGIGKADLHGEQLAVFESILPNPLRYSMGRETNRDGQNGFEEAEGTKALSNADREAVKLKIVRELRMEVGIANDGGYTAGELPDDEKPGSPMPILVETKDAEFGRQVLVRGPNLPRKSDLSPSDARLRASIPGVEEETVGTMLKRVAAATGLRLFVTPNYSDREVVERGSALPAGDLLAAVAFGLCGTFRRVGDAYVLTNDLQGMAAHQARVAVWEDALKKEVQFRTAQWRHEIATGEGFRRIRYHGTLTDNLTAEEQANLEANDRGGNGPAFIPIGQADKTVRDSLLNLKDGLDIDRGKVGLSSNIRYEIILPGLGRAWWRGWLDSVEQYNAKPYDPTPKEPAPIALPLDPKGTVAGLVLRTETPADARRMVALVARRGVGELLLDTRSPEALTAAVAAGKASNVAVGLALRPWAVAPGEPIADPDRLATGEHGASLAATRQGMASLVREYVELSAYPPASREVIGPLDPAIRAHLATAGVLARVPGLARIAVLDLYLTGYALADSRSSGSYYYSAPLDVYLSYGYTEAQRAAYLRDKGVDPLDLENDMARTEMDFGPAWNQTYRSSPVHEDWQKAKGAWSHARALALARTLRAAAPNLPVALVGEPPTTQLPPLASGYLYPLETPEALPAAPVDYGGGPLPEAAAFRVIDLADDPDPVQRLRVANRLARLFAKPGKPLLLDLSSVSPARTEAVLALWLREKGP